MYLFLYTVINIHIITSVSGAGSRGRRCWSSPRSHRSRCGTLSASSCRSPSAAPPSPAWPPPSRGWSEQGQEMFSVGPTESTSTRPPLVLVIPSFYRFYRFQNLDFITETSRLKFQRIPTFCGTNIYYLSARGQQTTKLITSQLLTVMVQVESP